MTTPIQRPVSTFSIVGYDPNTEEIGIAVQSKFLAVGSVVPWAVAKVGAVALQSWSNTSYARPSLQLIHEGLHPEEVIARLVADDAQASFRQVGLVDTKGRSATFTGEDCLSWAGGVCGENFAAQGNILVGKETVEALAETFKTSQGDLAERLSLCLVAAQKAGGDRRGMQSAALYIAKAHGGYGGFNDRYVDIRVDDHKDPITELRRILTMWRLQFFRTKPGNITLIADDNKDFILNILDQEGYYNGQRGEWDDSMQAAFASFCLSENFEEREAPAGYVDREVLDYLSSVYS